MKITDLKTLNQFLDQKMHELSQAIVAQESRARKNPTDYASKFYPMSTTWHKIALPDRQVLEIETGSCVWDS